MEAVIPRTMSMGRLMRQLSSAGHVAQPLLAEARHTFLNLVRSSYLHQFESGFCDTWPALRHLLEACAVAHDSADEPLDEWARSLANLTGMSRAAKWLTNGEAQGLGMFRKRSLGPLCEV